LAKAITVAKRISVPKLPQLRGPRSLKTYNFPFVLDVLARTYKKQGDLDKAIAEYERLTKFDPQSNDRRLINPVYHYRLAKLYQESGLSSKAISRYEKFLNIWKNADEDLPELIDAKARLARLKKMSIKAG
jgi:tetratricopeptide (TPR) repeat protein